LPISCLKEGLDTVKVVWLGLIIGFNEFMVELHVLVSRIFLGIRVVILFFEDCEMRFGVTFLGALKAVGGYNVALLSLGLDSLSVV